MDAAPVCDGNTGHVKRFFLFLLVDVQRMCRGLVSETGTDKWDEQVLESESVTHGKSHGRTSSPEVPRRPARVEMTIGLGYVWSH